MQKTFADGGKITKFVKVFSLESFPLYGIASLTAIASVSDKIGEAYYNFTAESNSCTCKNDKTSKIMSVCCGSFDNMDVTILLCLGTTAVFHGSLKHFQFAHHFE